MTPVPFHSPSAGDPPDCRGLDLRMYAKSENNLEPIRALQLPYSEENQCKSDQIQSVKDTDFNHFSKCCQPYSGPGVPVSTPDCLQARGTPSSPSHDNLGCLRHSEIETALGSKSLPPLRYVLKYTGSYSVIVFVFWGFR